MFKKNATSGDVKKSQSKCLDVKRDTPTRLKHLRTVLGEGPTPILFSCFSLPLRLISSPCWGPRRSSQGGGLCGCSFKGHKAIICFLLMCVRRLRSDGEGPPSGINVMGIFSPLSPLYSALCSILLRIRGRRHLIDLHTSADFCQQANIRIV